MIGSGRWVVFLAKALEYYVVIINAVSLKSSEAIKESSVASQTSLRILIFARALAGVG